MEAVLWELGAPGFVDISEQLPTHPQLRYERREPSEIQYIILHHTAWPARQSLWEIARFHVQERGWPGIGYHMVIDARGQAFKTNPDLAVTYHAREYNCSALGLALLGHFGQSPPTPEQYRAALYHAARYARAYGIPPERVLGHGEVVKTECPGAQFPLQQFLSAPVTN